MYCSFWTIPGYVFNSDSLLPTPTRSFLGRPLLLVTWNRCQFWISFEFLLLICPVFCESLFINYILCSWGREKRGRDVYLCKNLFINCNVVFVGRGEERKRHTRGWTICVSFYQGIFTNTHETHLDMKTNSQTSQVQKRFDIHEICCRD